MVWFTKKSLIEALSRPEPIIFSHVEMSAWPKVYRFIEDLFRDHPKDASFILKVFVMPEMTAEQYFNEWLPDKGTDYGDRAIRAGWELYHAPRVAHFLITNIIDPSGVTLDVEAKTLIHMLYGLFKEGIQFPDFELPYSGAGLVKIPDILAAQTKLLTSQSLNEG